MIGKKKQLILVLALILLSTTVVGASSIKVNGDAAVLISAETGQVLYKKNKSRQLPTASLTKIMTVFTALEQVEAGEVKLDDLVTITNAAESMGGSQLWLAAGEQLLLKDLLKATLLPSANDAAVAVAEYIGGNSQNFVEMMNKNAQELGLTETHFVNSTGLPTEAGSGESTPGEIAELTRQLIIQHPKVLTWTSHRVTYIHNRRPIYNTNNLIGHYRGADGLQTGWTKQADYCLAATAKRSNERLISVILGTKSETARVRQTRKLLNYGFDMFSKQQLIKQGTKVTTIQVKKGEQRQVQVTAANSLEVFIKQGIQKKVKQNIKLAPSIKAPLKNNEQVGQLVYRQKGEKLGTVKLKTADQVDKAKIITLLLRWLKHKWIKLIRLVDKALAR